VCLPSRKVGYLYIRLFYTSRIYMCRFFLRYLAEHRYRAQVIQIYMYIYIYRCQKVSPVIGLFYRSCIYIYTYMCKTFLQYLAERRYRAEVCQKAYIICKSRCMCICNSRCVCIYAYVYAYVTLGVPKSRSPL